MTQSTHDTAGANTIHSVRGATGVDRDESELVSANVCELVQRLMLANQLTEHQVVNVIFSQTPDLQADNPARCVRSVGFAHVPLFCTQEPMYKGSVPRIIRALITYRSTFDHTPVPVYINGAQRLRPDLSNDTTNSLERHQNHPVDME